MIKLMIENCADFQFILDIYGNVRKEFTYMIADQTQLIELLLKNKDYRNRRSYFGMNGYYEDQRGRRDCDCEETINIVNQNMDQLTVLPKGLKFYGSRKRQISLYVTDSNNKSQTRI